MCDVMEGRQTLYVLPICKYNTYVDKKDYRLSLLFGSLNEKTPHESCGVFMFRIKLSD